jgi:hypothetical protein
MSSTGAVQAPQRHWTNNLGSTQYFYGARPTTCKAADTNGPGYATNYGDRLDAPIFQVRSYGSGGITQQSLSNDPMTSNFMYQPQMDPVTGTLVPGAYPINISKSYSEQWTQGGKCKGIFKSLSMPYATMKNYWQSANQTFTISGQTYMPVVINSDMWLVRVA